MSLGLLVLTMLKEHPSKTHHFIFDLLARAVGAREAKAIEATSFKLTSGKIIGFFENKEQKRPVRK